MAVNQQIKVAQTVGVVLQLVNEHGGEFNFISMLELAKRAASPAHLGVMHKGVEMFTGLNRVGQSAPW
jgi:hypothetical protein